MKYHVGDKFIVNGVEGIVKYVNNGYAWLFPLQDQISFENSFNGSQLMSGLAFAKLDEKGRLSDGTRAFAVINTECAAV